MKTTDSGYGDIGKDPTLESTEYEGIIAEINKDLVLSFYKNTFFDDISQIKHIFAKREGHLADTPKNRATLLRVANDETLYRGTDMWGNKWYIEKCGNGGQYWARVRNGKINEGGYNRTPVDWNPITGLYKQIAPVNFKKKKSGGK